MEKLLRHLKKNLTQCPTILGKERKYRNAAVLIPIVEMDKEQHLLFQVRADHIRQGGEIGFPGGMAEPEDEGSYERTAIRETVEELGIKENQIQVLGFLGTYVPHSDVTVDVYVATLHIHRLEDLKLSDEVKEVFTVSLRELESMACEVHFINMRIQQSFVDEEGDEVVLLDAASLGLPERYHQSHYTRKRKIYFYRYMDHTIWGMTGEMLFEFLELLK